MREYYFLSDLHLGGDGELMQCDFADEFVAFIDGLAEKGGDVELIVGGDTFGFWELTTIKGVARFDAIVDRHRPIFDALKAAGERITITLMVGNHDYDLACDPVFREKLKAWNLGLDTAISLRRGVAGRTVWIEHGQQSDAFNASPDYGNAYALPLGYFITEEIVGGASRYSEFGRGDWLKDIRSVGTAHIPDWVLSNYFYREMGWAIRAVFTVFLSLFTLTLVAVVAEILRRLGVIDGNWFLRNPFFRDLGFVGNILTAVVAINMVIFAFMLIVSIPAWLVLHDIRRTLRRFQISGAGIATLEGQGDAPYLERAREVFGANPDAAVYIFGHTHDAFLAREEDGRVILNMGTWLKILRRVPVRFGYMPAVYYPSFRLNYFHIAEEDARLVIRYVEIPKTPARELGFLQRLVTLWRHPETGRPIPALTVLDPPAGNR